ncbi:MAG: hypothetical protein JEZ11_17930 [Desulfobacterales bacterium]|nr:hypothetical protein [Desulfobacterales bacterium]
MIGIIDGNNLAFSSNMATRLHTADDFPTQAIKGFFVSLRSYMRKFQLAKIFVVWDGGKSKRRMVICPEYKANRAVEKTPPEAMAFEEFKMQVPLIKRGLFDLGATQCVGHLVEGDDIAALLAMAAENVDTEAIIFSSDADFLQLVSNKVSVYSVTSYGKQERHTHIGNMEKLKGLRPDQWLEYKAMLGDKSDNIAGVKGVGEKTAKTIMKTFGSLTDFKNVVEGTETCPVKLGKRELSVLANLELVQRNIEMMDLRRPAMEFSAVKMFRRGVPNFSALKCLFLEYELKSLYLDFEEWISDFNCMRTSEA